MKIPATLAAFLSLVLLCTADDAAPRPGFWERAWQSTKNAGSKTVGAATSPFRRGEDKGRGPSSAGRHLVMSIALQPGIVKLSQTRVVEVTVSVVNKGRDTARLEFPNSQRIEVLLKNGSGKILARWSDDQKIEKEPAQVAINPGERIEYSARISTRDMAAGQPCIIEAFFRANENLRTSRTLTPER